MLHGRRIQFQQIAQPKCLFHIFIPVGVGDAPPRGSECGTRLGKPLLLKHILSHMERHTDGRLI